MNEVKTRAQLATELAELRTRVANAQALAHVGILDWNPVTDEMKWSDEAFRIHGYEPGSIQPTIELAVAAVHPDDQAMVQRTMGAALRGEGKHDTDHRLVQPGGEVRWVRARIAVTRDADGKPIHVLGTHLDITERKRAEAAAEMASVRIEHLNRVLAALRRLGQVLVQAREPTELADEVCRLLVEERGYRAAWLELDGERGVLHQAGGPTPTTRRLAEAATESWFTPCLREAAGGDEVFVVDGVTCADTCTVGHATPPGAAVIVAPIKHADRLLGVLGVSVAPHIEINAEELELVGQVARDIAFGLHVIQSRAAREEIEALHHHLINNVRDVICLLDQDLALTWVSPSIERAVGYTAAELMELPSGRVATEESGNQVREALARSFGPDSDRAGDEDHEVELDIECRTKGGCRVWLRTRFSLLLGPNGTPLGVLASAHDVTKEKLDHRSQALETAVLRAMEQAATPADALPAALAALKQVTGLDTVRLRTESSDLALLLPSDVGEPAYQSIALVPLEVEGQTMHVLELADRRAELFSPEDIESFQLVSRRLGGAIERRDTWVAAQLSRGLEAAVAAVSVEFLRTGDLCRTAQTLLHHAIELSGARLGLFLDQDDEGTIRIRAMGGVDSEQFLRMPGFEEARGRLDTVGFVPLDMGPNLLTNVILEGEHVRAPEPSRHPAWTGPLPEEHPPLTNLFACPMVSDKTVLGGLVLANHPDEFASDQEWIVDALANAGALCLRSARDEAQRSRVEGQLITSRRMESVGRLAGGVAHDFNNILTVIRGYTGFALKKLRYGDPLRKDLEQVQNAAGKASGLTRQLLAFGRRQAMYLQPVDLNAVIEDLGKMLRRLIGEDIEVHETLRPGLRLCTADVGQIEQVLMNLVVNARDAMPNGGDLHIRTEETKVVPGSPEERRGVPTGCYVRTTVADTGIGMDEQTRHRAFEPFFTTKEAGKGTGLGLATAYGIVKQSGGDISVRSEPGKGATFEILLPITDNGPAAQTGPIPTIDDLHGSETLLLVEDDDQVREITRRTLEAVGYTVITAANAGEALLACEKNHGALQLLVTDVVMPGMSGPELVERLSQDCPHMRVVYVSGYAEDVLDSRGVLDSGTHFVAKPFGEDELEMAVRRALDGPTIEGAW